MMEAEEEDRGALGKGPRDDPLQGLMVRGVFERDFFCELAVRGAEGWGVERADSMELSGFYWLSTALIFRN